MGDTKNTVKEQDFQVIDGGKGADNKDTIKINKLKVFKSELVNVEYLNADDLFSEFDSIKVITFSYDINFMDHLMQFFKYGEIILGADYMAQKDGKLNDLLEVAANNYEAIQAVKSKKHLVEMIAKGDLNLRTSNYILDHRKIYLLKSDDGRTRVIKASANMSGRAWNGEHMEHYEYDDTPFCYEEYEKDFETAWLMASDVPYTMISGKKSEDYIEGNPMIKRAKETDKVTVVQTSSEPVNLEIVKYMIDHTRIKEDYKEIFNGCGAQNKGGVIELKPKVIKKVEMGLKKLNNKRRISVSVQERFYPELTFDWNEQKAFMDGTELDLHPSVEDVRKDIDELMQVFQNFEMFVDETGDLQATHFKFMNFIFESPFHAKLRFAILSRIGTALYREYLGRMMTAVTNLIEFIDEKKPQETNDMWYPDLVNISSKILIEIFKENGYNIPSYMRELEWNKDYYGANYIAENTIRSIRKEYEENPETFVIGRDTVKIEAGGADAIKKFKSWENTLPAEMRAKSSQMRDGSCFISMNRKELEDRLGFKLKKNHILSFFKNK